MNQQISIMGQIVQLHELLMQNQDHIQISNKHNNPHLLIRQRPRDNLMNILIQVDSKIITNLIILPKLLPQTVLRIFINMDLREVEGAHLPTNK